jgi:microsomal dipeptidase-like Zn-dependent dipeptidase
VADLGLIGDALARRGYSTDDVEAILSRNWLRVLHRVLPKDAAG